MKTVAQLPVSQRTAYQFPIYRWIGWLAVAGFAVGLTVMFFISGMFGLPAPLLWAGVVVLFTFGALLLDKPKLLLNVMLFYFLLLPSNRLLGLIWLPIPGGLNKFFFIPLIAVIIMNWIQRRQLREATFFPIAFCVLTVLSWYVNGKPSLFGTVQLTLVMLRCYILWYYCRLTCTFESEKQLARWMWGYVGYIAIQFAYNILWQKGLWVKTHADRSGGVFGPMSGGEAHWIGYMSTFGLLLIAGWWLSSGIWARSGTRKLVLVVAGIIVYNLVVMTDTKHMLLMLPIIALPLVVHPRFPVRLRVSLLVAGTVFFLGSVFYVNQLVGRVQMQSYLDAAFHSPRAKMFRAVTIDFSRLVPYPILGAGPGSFASPQAVAARTPLARRYIIPYEDDNRRRGYFGLQGSVVSASIIGATQSDFLILMGEYGWLATAVYYAFFGWLIYRLLQKGKQVPQGSLLSGLYVSMACCMIAQAILLTLVLMLINPALTYPVWILMGRMWDMKPHPDAPQPLPA